MAIIGNYIDYTNLPVYDQIAIPAFWVIGAAVFTLLTGYQINSYYQKPIEEFAEAARKVASGDFSVYVSPRHTSDKSNYLDVIFTDFNKMVEELGSIETLKTDFFSNVSHEIKTPLSVICNYAELLQKDTISEAQRQEYAEMIIQATKRLSDLITNMLKLNKLEKQAIGPMTETYDVCQQLCECALQFEDAWEKKGIEFVAEVEEYALIEADRGLLELVWTNLLSNAIKFTSAGGTVTLTQTSNTSEITVMVSDTGCGMNQETKQHIFDKFYQGDTSHATEGNGLGLALVQRILQLSEGTVTVDSTVGKGTAFTVILPAYREEKNV
jgi:signal transduction histidine kinase